MEKKFLLCFHDLSVQNHKTVLPVLLKLKKIAGPFSVLVIPCVDGATAEQVGEFRGTLKLLLDEGFELALHGFRHSAELDRKRSLFGKLALSMTGNEAEFAGLGEFESERLFQSAIDAWDSLFKEIPLNPIAFVPPTWYGNSFLMYQALDRGMIFEGRFKLALADGVGWTSLVTSFAGIPAWSECLAFAFGSFILKMPFGVPRIALHPVDFPKYENKIIQLVKKALESRELVMYRQLLQRR